MRERYVVDTNVLIAASAADPEHPTDIDATPAEPELRLAVWNWLKAFEEGDARLVLDQGNKIFDEYRRKLSHHDYGIAVLQHKFDTASVEYVSVEYDRDGNGILPDTLSAVIHDLADRKMVAAALSSHLSFGEGCIAFAGDTDWHDWEAALAEHKVLLEPIIEDWSRRKHAEKQHRRTRNE